MSILEVTQEVCHVQSRLNWLYANQRVEAAKPTAPGMREELDKAVQLHSRAITTSFMHLADTYPAANEVAAPEAA